MNLDRTDGTDRIPSPGASPLDVLLGAEAEAKPTTAYGRAYSYPYGRRWRTVEVEFDGTPRQVERVNLALAVVERYVRSRRKGAVVARATAHRILACWVARYLTAGDGKGPETPLDLARRFRVTVPRVRALLAAFKRYRLAAVVPERDEAFRRLAPFRERMNRCDNR